MNRSGSICCALTVAALHAITAHAAPPDAGQTLRELQRQPALTAPAAASEATTEHSADPHSDNAVRFTVRSVKVSGNTEIPTERLLALIEGLNGAERSLSDLEAAAAKITRYYRQHGYAVARAYVPTQEIRDGVVSIGVIEGRIDRPRIDNHSRLSDERAEAYLDRIKEGAVVTTDTIERGLLLLNDTPGVGSSRATLQPGASVGTSELLVEVTPAAAYSGTVDVDNYGNRYTQEYRFGGTLNANSPLEIGDQLSLNALTSGHELSYGRLAYQLPLGSDGLRIGAAYFYTRYRLGEEFNALDAHGTAAGGSAFAVYPFIRTQRSNLSASVSWEQKKLGDAIDATDTTTDKRIHVATLGLSGNYRDRVAGGGASGLSVSLATGNLDIESPAARAIDDASARSSGRYTRVSYDANRLQRLTEAAVLSISVSGQFASKNLDSSEKFALGGAHGVRAYPQGEGVGDEGYVATLEARLAFTSALQGIAFYDAGSVTLDRNRFSASAPNHRTLAGAGVGANADVAGFQVQAAVAWRTQGGEPTSVPQAASHAVNFWVQAAKAF